MWPLLSNGGGGRGEEEGGGGESRESREEMSGESEKEGERSEQDVRTVGL